MKQISRQEEAINFLYKAYDHQIKGEIPAAILNYKKSIELCETAEAYTFLGWTYSFQKKYDEAISECKKAIDIDPEFGNPYNDIGAYLIEKGCLDEAMPFLTKAMKCKNYDNPCYPHYNIGRIWEEKGDFKKAMRSYQRALRDNSDYKPAKIALQKIQVMYN